jgi:hypothetical protein
LINEHWKTHAWEGDEEVSVPECRKIIRGLLEAMGFNEFNETLFQKVYNELVSDKSK